MAFLLERNADTEYHQPHSRQCWQLVRPALGTDTVEAKVQ